VKLSTEEDVKARAQTLLSTRAVDMVRLERIRMYLTDPDPSMARRTSAWNRIGPLRWLPKATPPEVRRLAEIARVNLMKFVVNAVVQDMYIDGFRVPLSGDDEPTWEIWQRNRMDARQIGTHRSALCYGTTYVTVLPGDPVPVIRGASPRRMTTLYADADDDWPALALERRGITADARKRRVYRLMDDENVWWLEANDTLANDVTVDSSEEHGVGHVPVVRFRNTLDDDGGDVEGEVEPLIPLQDQINITTFGLLVAQHYGAFRQRYILGWLADSEQQALEASARKLWTFEDPETKVGEFGQTDLKGYLDSREATLRHLATISQTPAHEMIGALINLSAEALAAADASHRRKVSERQVVMGEAWEQVLELAGKLNGTPTDPAAYVRWRDTESRSLSQVADALGKLTTMLGVPPKELWERIPNVSQQEVERWRAAAAEGDAFAQLATALNRQAGPPEAPPTPAGQ